MLPHFLRASTSKNNASITYITNVTNAGGGTTMSMTITGTMSEGLYILGFIGESTTTSSAISSATFNGNAATLAVKNNTSTGGPSGLSGGIFYYRQTTSITNPVVSVTFSASNARANVGVWRIDTNSSDTPFTTDTVASSSTASSLSNTITNLNNKYVVVSLFSNNQFASTTWTNATERYEAFTGSTGGSGADYSAISYEASRTITATPASSTAGLILNTAVWK